MHGEFFFGMLVFGVLLWGVGHDLIRSFFKQKGEIIDRIIERERE